MNIATKNYRYLIIIVMMYMTIDLTSMVYAYKEIKIGFVVGMASSIVFPITYLIMDILTEVYGYKIARAIIWYGIICDFIFSCLTYSIAQLPSPSSSQHATYQIVFEPLIRAVIAQTIGVLVGAFINIYLVAKWKIIVKGKYFWLRSIGSSAIGEAAMLVISVFIALGGILKLSTIGYIILYAYAYKIIFAILFSPIANILAYFLKQKEGIDVYDQYLDFNPFKISTVEN